MTSHRPLGSTLREFLLDLYQLSERVEFSEHYLSPSDLTHLLYATPASLSRSMAELKKMNLVEHQPYHGVRLTEAGRQAALPFIRRQRIAEAFLNQVMGFEWDTIHEEAKRLVGGMTEAVTERMFEIAGSPQTCPHGEPIPDRDGHFAPPNDHPLHHLPFKTPLVITRVLAREPDRLKYIGALRLRPGTPLQVIHIAPFDGPLQLRLPDEFRIIGHNLAEVIYARPVENQ